MQETGVKYMCIILIIMSLIVSGMFFSSCEDPEADRAFYQEESITIFDYIDKHKEKYSYFRQVIIAGEMEDALTAYNPFGDGFTFFLPTDDAFERYISSQQVYADFDQMLNDKNFIRELGRYHLVNKSLNTNEFPYGALPDTTATGDFLTIGFSSDLDTTFYKVNNIASVEAANIKLANGYIHILSDVLEPVAYSSFEWLKRSEGFSLIAGLFEITGLADTMGIYRKTNSGQIIKNRYTVLAEHDSIFARNGIFSLNDLINKYNSPGKPYNDPDNGLYQFAAYHLLEGSYFLDEFEGSMNYNTYANFPVQINAGMDIRINQGVDTFGYLITGVDTSVINYIRLFYQESNQVTKNGAIHAISEVMNLFRPTRSVRTFQFYEEPRIAQVRNISSVHEFVDPEKFEVLYWTGPENIYFVKAAGSGDRANNEDYLLINGNFTLNYKIPKLIPGKYKVTLKANAFSQNNATIQVFIDGRKIGGNLDLTVGGTTINPYKVYTAGETEFSAYSEHDITIRSLIPGQLIWDYISFEPV